MKIEYHVGSEFNDDNANDNYDDYCSVDDYHDDVENVKTTRTVINQFL